MKKGPSIRLRLARSVPDTRHIADVLAALGIKLQLGSSAHDSMERVFLNILAASTKFEADLIRMRTCGGAPSHAPRPRCKL